MEGSVGESCDHNAIPLNWESSLKQCVLKNSLEWFNAQSIQHPRKRVGLGSSYKATWDLT